jgi:hypothetical protein
MKGFAGLVFLTAAAALSANATVVSCTVSDDAGHNLTSVATGSGPNTGFSIAGGTTGGSAATAAISCPGLDAGAGLIITNFQLLGTAGYTGGPFGTTTGTQTTETFTALSGAFSGASVAQTSTGGTDPSVFLPGNPFQIGSTVSPGTQTTSSFFVSILSSVSQGGPVAASSGQVVLSYTTQPVTSGVPEPVSMLLFGSGLLAVSLIGRKKFTRK